MQDQSTPCIEKLSSVSNCPELSAAGPPIPLEAERSPVTALPGAAAPLSSPPDAASAAPPPLAALLTLPNTSAASEYSPASSSQSALLSSGDLSAPAGAAMPDRGVHTSMLFAAAGSPAAPSPPPCMLLAFRSLLLPVAGRAGMAPAAPPDAAAGPAKLRVLLAMLLLPPPSATAAPRVSASTGFCPLAPGWAVPKLPPWLLPVAQQLAMAYGTSKEPPNSEEDMPW